MSMWFDPSWQFPDNLLPLTREQKVKAYYLAMAGTCPGPNKALIAAMLAHRLVEIEDAEEGVS